MNDFEIIKVWYDNNRDEHLIQVKPNNQGIEFYVKNSTDCWDYCYGDLQLSVKETNKTEKFNEFIKNNDVILYKGNGYCMVDEIAGTDSRP